MLKIKGTYQDGRVDLDSRPTATKAIKVIVTFPDPELSRPVNTSPDILQWDDFSFDKARQLLKDLKSPLSDEVTTERRNA